MLFRERLFSLRLKREEMIKNSKTFRPEILAPCGSYDILKAAISAGADACYIGGEKFGARAFAKNLGADYIIRAIDYAHLHGTKLYLTVNTLFKESELMELYEYLLPYYEAGIDAVIVQDLGAFSLIRQYFPNLHIHCSTQMNINSIHGARYMMEQGASRVVTAREMPLSEIKKIKEALDIEIESFVHGAMCYSYSGQCLMSSLAGGRSGNRGRCAQPCRKCYDGEYILSMKDMCTLTLIPKLFDAGIDSFKIEGRMKNEYYVASTVDAYKTLVDMYINGEYSLDKANEYRDRLANIYNRGGFSEGYYFTHNGPSMISVDRPNNSGILIGETKAVNNGKVKIFLSRDLLKQDVLELSIKNNSFIEITSPVAAKSGSEVWLNCPKTKDILIGKKVRRTRCNELIDSIEKDIINVNNKKIFLDIKINALLDSPINMTATFCMENNRHILSVDSDIVVQKAMKQPVTKEIIEDKLGKFTDETFSLGMLDIDVFENAFFPSGEIKKLRRRLISDIEDFICNLYRRKSSIPDNYISVVFPNDIDSLKPKLKVSVKNLDQLKAVATHDNIYGIYMSASLYNNASEAIIDALKGKNIKIFIELPYIIKADMSLDDMLSGIDYDGLYIRNIDTYAMLCNAKFADKEVVLGNSLYAYNNVARTHFAEKINNPCYELPAELNLTELKNLNQTNTELLVYQYKQVMLSNQCVTKNIQDCTKNNQIAQIKDDMGNIFYSMSICEECCSVVYNGIPYSIIDKLSNDDIIALNVNYHKIEFTIESPDEVEKVLNTYREAALGNFKRLGNSRITTGHLYRGVE